MVEEKLLSTTEVAAELGVSRQRVLALVKTGRLKTIKIGSYNSYKLSDLDAVRERKPGKPKKTKEE